MKHLTVSFLVLLMLSSCAAPPELIDTSTSSPTDLPAATSSQHDLLMSSPPPSSMPPPPGDANLRRANVYIDVTEILIRESFPPQIALLLKGELATPCHRLRVDVSQPDQENKIRVEAYSVVNPQLMCAQVITGFEESVNLGSFPAGHYEVWVNDVKIGEFDS